MSEKAEEQEVRMSTPWKILLHFAMVCIIVSCLFLSFRIVVYGDPEYRFQQREYEKYDVAPYVNMEMDDIMDVTVYMMEYLDGRQDELSIVSYVDGETKDFFNDDDRLHMADVRTMFIGVTVIMYIGFILAAVIIVIMLIRKEDLRHELPRAFRHAGLILLALLVILGIACVIDFNAVFRVFHLLFFSGDTWLFDPAVDYMIRILPEGLFYDYVIWILIWFVGIMVVLTVGSFVWNHVVKRQDAKRVLQETEDKNTDKAEEQI